MSELDVAEQLLRYGEAAEAAVDFAVANRPARLIDRGGVWHRLPLLAAVAAIVVVGMLTAAVVLIRRNDTAPATGFPRTPAPGAWTTFPAAPIAADGKEQIVATDDELVVWSGDSDATEETGGAALSFADHTWRRIAPSPLSPRVDPVLVWTGREVLVWGGHAVGAEDDLLFDGAAYDPATDSWRALADRGWGALRDKTGVAWTGQEVVLVGVTSGPGADLVSDTFAFDPETDAWRPLPRSQLSSDRRATVAGWTGRRVVVVAIADYEAVEVDVLLVGGGDVWESSLHTALPGVNVDPRHVTLVGDQLVVARPGGPYDDRSSAGLLSGLVIDPEVERFPEEEVTVTDQPSLDSAEVDGGGPDGGIEMAPPDDSYDGDPALLPAVGLDGIAVSGDSYLDLASLEWHRLPALPGPERTLAQAVVHRGLVYVWGGTTCFAGANCPEWGDPGIGLVWRPPE
jgi:hypothetical protein